MGSHNIDISVIVPVFNVEEYLPACIDSILQQGQLRYEIILVNDGSTDSSGEIADSYAQKDCRVKVIHQENGEASTARNAGLNLAQGEYIAFVDSDDFLKENSLRELYNVAVKNQTDVVLGSFRYYPFDNNSQFNPIPEKLFHFPICGKECFISLMKSGSYRPMVWNYIYRRSFLEKINARFVIGVTPHEDELWMPVVLCQASTIVITDAEFYYYRQREGSVMHATNVKKRVDACIRVANQLLDFASQFDFSEADGELKNWLYVNIYRLYATAFTKLPKIKDSSYILPEHQLDRFWRSSSEMMLEPQRICKSHFRRAEIGLKKYTDWRLSDWVASVGFENRTGKKMMLIYNTMWNGDLTLKWQDVPTDWIITTDRRYFQQADAVVFHLPDLIQEMEHDLDKSEGQTWVAWYVESDESCQSFIKDPEISELFDLWMSYPQEAEQQCVHPIVRLCVKLEEVLKENKHNT